MSKPREWPETKIAIDMTEQDVRDTFADTYGDNSLTGSSLWGIYQCFRDMHPDLTPFELFVMTEDHHIEALEKKEK